MINKSIFETKKEIYPTLDENIVCDILIIGGGITGISTLYNLDKTNFKTILVEQNEIGGFTTKRSTGKLSYLQNDLLYNIYKTHGESKLKLYLESQIEAINNITNLIKNEKIDCDLEKVPSIIYTNSHNEIKYLKFLKNFLNNNNIKVDTTNPHIVESVYAIKGYNTYIFNPFKFVINLAKKINSNIYENTKIIKVKRIDDYYLCYTKNSIIKAKYIVLASHYPYFLVPYFFPFKTSLEKSFISISNYKKNKISLISYTNPFVSIRTYKDKLIYLSNSMNINSHLPNLNELKKLNPSNLYSNIDVMSNDYLPFIGKIKNNLFLATAYNTWGLTNGFLASNIISDLILNKSNKYAILFNPKRKSLKTISNIFSSINNNLKGFIKGFKYGNHKCTHMGCKLIYNEIDNTFDCPCHGSRFNKNGKVLIGPAIKNIKK